MTCQWFKPYGNTYMCFIDIPDSLHFCAINGDLTKTCPFAVDREHLREKDFREERS